MIATPIHSRAFLDETLGRFPQLLGAILVSPDGLLLDARVPDGLDPIPLAAVVAGWARTFDAQAQSSQQGGCALRLARGQIVVCHTEDGNIFGGLAEHQAPLSKLLNAIIEGQLGAVAPAQ